METKESLNKVPKKKGGDLSDLRSALDRALAEPVNEKSLSLQNDDA